MCIRDRDSVAFSGTKAEGWYLPAVQQAMEEGKIASAGKYLSLIHI